MPRDITGGGLSRPAEFIDGVARPEYESTGTFPLAIFKVALGREQLTPRLSFSLAPLGTEFFGSSRVGPSLTFTISAVV